MRITVHDGLSRLKRYKELIEKLTAELTLVAVKQGNRLTTTRLTEEQFRDEARARYQRITDLISNYRNLKAAIVLSNATTTVIVGARAMTVAQAIEYRRESIEFQRQLVVRLTTEFVTREREVVKLRAAVEESAVRAATAAVGSKTEGNAADFMTIVEAYMRNHDAQLFDPVGAQELASSLANTLTDFDREVDGALTASNVTTFIDVELNGNQ